MTQTMLHNITFDELTIGQTASIKRTLTWRDIELFAYVSGDVNPAHLDQNYAEHTAFHGIIGHGMWSGALISALLGTVMPGPGTIYLGQELKFEHPVHVGDEITVSLTVKTKHPTKPVVTFDCVCSNTKGENVVEGTATVLAPTQHIETARPLLPSVVISEHPLAPADGIVPVAKGRTLKGLVVGLANDQSIAWGCVQAFQAAGADLAITYQNEKTKSYIAPLAERVGAEILLPLDVTNEAHADALFADIKAKWGRLDFLLHSVAFAPKADLQGRLVDSSAAGFGVAMDISCHSLIRLAKRAEPLMVDGGSILTMSYYGAEKAIPNYNLMGPVKAALEASVRYLARDLGPKGIRVNAISPGPVMTRAASGLGHFDELMVEATAKAPLHQLVSLGQIGALAAFLVGDGARQITGQTLYIDGGFSAAG